MAKPLIQKSPPELRGGSPTVSQQPAPQIIPNAPARAVAEALSNAKSQVAATAREDR